MLITDGVGFATLQPPHFPGTDSSMAKDVRKLEGQITPRKYPASYLELLLFRNRAKKLVNTVT
jgi:hypothetical protein